MIDNLCCDCITNRVLIIGVYLLDVPNHAVAITDALRRTRDWEIDIRWVAAGCGSIPSQLEEVTVRRTEKIVPKFSMLNQVIDSIDINQFQYIIVIDDDIELDNQFLDFYLWLQGKIDLALAQPARTPDSYIDHPFVTQLPGIGARHTRFVEIGPLFSIRRDIYPLIIPFDDHTPMGWGLDYYWPHLLERLGYRLGIIDATPVRHSLRPPVSLYGYQEVANEMTQFLSTHEHLSEEEAFTNIQCYPLRPPPGLIKPPILHHRRRSPA